MSEPDRITREQIGLTPTVDERPTPGRRVFGLQHGGCLIQLIWTSTSHLEIDAWMDYPSVPEKVKAIQASRVSPPLE